MGFLDFQSFPTYPTIRTAWLLFKGLSHVLEGRKCGLSAFCISLFEKNILDDFEVQDYFPEV